jgi:predicted dehydrogenase
MENSRRTFIKKSTLGAAAMAIGGVGMSAKSYGRIIGANDRLNLAVIGLGRRLPAFIKPITIKENNVHLMYLCDVMESQRTKAAETFSSLLDYKPALENDVRKIQDDPNVDIMLHLTPDHWHAPGACYAVQSGKHVYVEKPCSHNPHEGQLLIDFQKKYKKVMQVGNQARSSTKTQEAVKQIHDGLIGKTYKAITFYSNNRGEVPVQKSAPVPQGLDWDLFQGPAPRQEYTHDTWDYNWHWYGWTWGTAESGNNMIHRFDLARWAMQLELPERVDVTAGKYHFPDDGWTMYDTLNATFVYPDNKVIICDCKSRNSYKTYGANNGAIVFGTDGAVFLSGSGYKHYDRDGKLVKEDDSREDTVNNHFVNFLESVRGKETPNSPVDEAEKSTILCHLSNIAYRIGEGFDVNCQNGQALNRKALKLWKRAYEPGWEPKI